MNVGDYYDQPRGVFIPAPGGKTLTALVATALSLAGAYGYHWYTTPKPDAPPATTQPQAPPPVTPKGCQCGPGAACQCNADRPQKADLDAAKGAATKAQADATAAQAALAAKADYADRLKASIEKRADITVCQCHNTGGHGICLCHAIGQTCNCTKEQPIGWREATATTGNPFAPANAAYGGGKQMMGMARGRGG